MTAVVLTYHAVDSRDGPLCVDPGVFAAQLDCVVDSGARVVTVSDLARAVRTGRLGEPHVAITFDDGLASVARVAAPLLADRGLPATVFCVAGHIGGTNDWPTARPGSPRLELAAADELGDLARQGWEIGCHGMTHAPLIGDEPAFLERELVEARIVLEELTGATVTSFAYPYGATPTRAAAQLVAAKYDAACSTRLGVVRSTSDVLDLPRIDSHYLRRPRLLRAALEDSLGPYLRVRRLGAAARRRIRHDYREAIVAR